MAVLELADITGSADVQAFRGVGFESVCFFVLISYFYPTACSPKGCGSGSAASLRQLAGVYIYFFQKIPSPTGATRSNPRATMPS